MACCMAEGSRSSSWACMLLRSEGPGYSTGCGEWCSCSATSPPCALQTTHVGLRGSRLMCTARRGNSFSGVESTYRCNPNLCGLDASVTEHRCECHKLFTSA